MTSLSDAATTNSNSAVTRTNSFEKGGFIRLQR
jgi:hypothetical protein